MVKNLPARQETCTGSLGWEDPLEKGMATHSSILSWKIPRTEEPVGYSSWGLRVGRDWVTNTHTHFYGTGSATQSSSQPFQAFLGTLWFGMAGETFVSISTNYWPTAMWMCSSQGWSFPSDRALHVAALCLAPRAATFSFWIWSAMDWMSVLSCRRWSCSRSPSVSRSQVRTLFRSESNCCLLWGFCFILSSLLRASAWMSSQRSITPGKTGHAQESEGFLHAECLGNAWNWHVG